jgi:hypothetical protein
MHGDGVWALVNRGTAALYKRLTSPCWSRLEDVDSIRETIHDFICMTKMHALVVSMPCMLLEKLDASKLGS